MLTGLLDGESSSVTEALDKLRPKIALGNEDIQACKI